MVAKIRLIAQGFEVFFPQYVKQGPKGSLLLPLFSSYLFAKFDPAECRWQSIHSTIGVSRILGYGEDSIVPTPCKPGVIEGLQAFCDSGDVVDMAKAFPAPDSGKIELKTGDRVEILNGMFKGQQATYWNHSKVGTHVILSLLNRPIRVIISDNEIAQR